MKSKDNIADLLTKGLTQELVEKASRGIGLQPMTLKGIMVETQPSGMDIP